MVTDTTKSYLHHKIVQLELHLDRAIRDLHKSNRAGNVLQSDITDLREILTKLDQVAFQTMQELDDIDSGVFTEEETTTEDDNYENGFDMSLIDKAFNLTNRPR